MHLSPTSEQPRKRRAINACVSCRTSKVRCDGKRPCQRCERNDAACAYSATVKDESSQRVEKLEAEVEELRQEIRRVQRNAKIDTVVNPLHSLDMFEPTALEDLGGKSNAVDAGLATWGQAEIWFQSFFSGSHYLVPIFSEHLDTIASVSCRSSFLFDAIVSIGCRAEQGSSSRVFCELQSRLREHLASLLIHTGRPPLETIQAITLMAAYSENGFVLIALAMRFAIQLGLPTAVDELVTRASARIGSPSHEEKELYRLARVWHGIVNLELFFSLDGGRIPEFAPRISARKIRTLINHPERTSVDVRLLSQVELNTIRADAHQAVARCGLNEDYERQVRTHVHEATIELSLWSDQWSSIISTEPSPHQKALALLNLRIQYEWALITLHLKAVAVSGIDNIAFMTIFQRDMIRKAKDAAQRHLGHFLEASNAPTSPGSPSQPVATYLQSFRWTMEYVWAKGAFSILLVLKLAILLRDPVQMVMTLLQDAHRVLEELKNVTIGYVPYFQILQTSVEKCEAALREHVAQQSGDAVEDSILNEQGTAETAFQDYVPDEFIFEWDFPGLKLTHMPLGWQELFVDIEGLF